MKDLAGAGHCSVILLCYIIACQFFVAVFFFFSFVFFFFFLVGLGLLLKFLFFFFLNNYISGQAKVLVAAKN